MTFQGIGGTFEKPANVHVLELDNDFWNKDDC